MQSVGMLQFTPTASVLVPTTEAAILSAISVYAGAEIAANSEHVDEAFQMLKVKAITCLDLTEGTVAYYYYYDDVSNAFQIVAGQPNLNVLNQIQSMRVMLQLVLDDQGNILSTGECYTTSLAFPPASPFAPTFP